MFFPPIVCFSIFYNELLVSKLSLFKYTYVFLKKMVKKQHFYSKKTRPQIHLKGVNLWSIILFEICMLTIHFI
jgi:hypothetical protein